MFRKVGYKKAIADTGWVSEVIIERFDASFELLSKCSVIYGGAVRDALAGMPLEGDIDISIPPNEFSTVHQAFNASTRWKSVNKSMPKFKSPGKYGKRQIPVISSIVEFEGVNGARAQLICSNDNESSPKESALYIPRNVDIICCGVVIDKDGIVYEVVEGAYDDCKRGILRLNEDMEHPHIESLKERAAKLEKRGWVDKLDMKKAQRLERKKQPKSPRLKKSKQKPSKRLSKENMIKDCVTTILDEGHKKKKPDWRPPPEAVEHDNSIEEIKWHEAGKWIDPDQPVAEELITIDPGTMPDRAYMDAQVSAIVDDAPDDEPIREEDSLDETIEREYKKSRDREWTKNIATFKRR